MAQWTGAGTEENPYQITSIADDFAFISNGEIKENSTANCQLSTANFTSGVYVLRLVNGGNIKTQKIVIK